MTADEVRSMITRSKHRVEEIREKRIDTVAMMSYHAGYQDALQAVLSALVMEEEFAREPKEENHEQEQKNAYII